LLLGDFYMWDACYVLHFLPFNIQSSRFPNREEEISE
jgi:hypothetical protein